MQPRALRMPFQRYHGALKQIATTAQLGCCALLLATLYSPVAAGAAGLTVVTERLEESTFGNRTAFYVLVANNSDRLQRVDLSGYDERWEPTGRLEFPQRQLWVPAGERRRALVVVSELAAGKPVKSYACITPLRGPKERICAELIAIRYGVEQALRQHTAVLAGAAAGYLAE